MEMFIERERVNALANISRAYVFVPPKISTRVLLTQHRYQHVTMRFLTDELAFESDIACLEFLKNHDAEHLVDGTANNSDMTLVRVKVKEGAALFEQLRQAFSKIDIKGQI